MAAQLPQGIPVRRDHDRGLRAPHRGRAAGRARAFAFASAWIDGVGVPSNAVTATSTRLAQIEAIGAAVPTPEQTKSWGPIEWALYLESVPRPAPHETCKELDATYKLTASTNMDVLVPWLTLALKSGYHPVLPRVTQVLGEQGRMKYLRPLYTALAADSATRATAAATLQRNAPSYHPIARQMVEGVLKAATP